jgi:hypothetical protein
MRWRLGAGGEVGVGVDVDQAKGFPSRPPQSEQRSEQDAAVAAK